ncbi:F-box only protein 39-like isoform X2 [Biomphalaria glabrata]|uniref:F-box only protein 39-like isoform X2 n=1 Tax=Biomphalaria glabrata TaxID=6526 RepID=A0A9W2YI72_BIOGL|nr:F-box only protein 39-like isoform X2 [Biomphalaria glabrata]
MSSSLMEPLAAKRLKLAMDNIHNSEIPNQDIKQPDWSLLPFTVLRHIYSFSSNKDRYNMSLTCKTWLEPFVAPEIWRSLTFRFDRNQDLYVTRFLKRILPVSLRHLNIDFKEADKGIIVSEIDSLECVKLVIRHRIIHQVKNLVSLRLANIGRFTKNWPEDRKRKDLVMLVKCFIEMQTDLQVFNLSCAGLDLETGRKMMLKLGLNCGSNVHKLVIDDFISNDYEGNEDFVDMMDKSLLEPLRYFTKLTSLTVSFNNLCGNVLGVLTTSGCLNCMRIFVVNVADPIRISSRRWRNLQTACPQLQIYFTFVNSTTSQNFVKILKPGIPLTGIKWNVEKGFQEENWVERTITECLSHVATKFKDSLRHVRVSLQVADESEAIIFNDIMKKLRPFVRHHLCSMRVLRVVCV